MLLGLTTSGYHACPTCGPSLVASRPIHLKKVIFENHHRFLPYNHSKFEPSLKGVPSHLMSVGDWQVYWNGVENAPPPGMTRYSIFFRLPYWSELKINHLLDPMHIFKNVAQQIWDHITSARDNLGVRQDLQLMGRLPDTWPIQAQNGKFILPKAPWILSKEEEKRVKTVIKSFRTPTGYMRSLKGAFTKSKKRGSEQLYGLKTHDWHKMLQVWMTSFLPVHIENKQVCINVK